MAPCPPASPPAPTQCPAAAPHSRLPQSQARTTQRVTADLEVPPHSYIRVHLHPKRFPAVHAVDWAQRIVAHTPEYVVLSKPAGVPAAPTVDNLLESAPSCAAQASVLAHGSMLCLLGLAWVLARVPHAEALACCPACCRHVGRRGAAPLLASATHPTLLLPHPAVQAVGHPVPLLVTSRLDQCTEGLLVLGKTKAFVAAFNELVKRSGSAAGPGSSDPASRCSSSDSGADGSSSAGSGAGGARPLRKFYRAATVAPPPLGLLRHHLCIERRQEGLPAFTIAHEAPVEGSLPAELRVLEVQPIR